MNDGVDLWSLPLEDLVDHPDEESWDILSDRLLNEYDNMRDAFVSVVMDRNRLRKRVAASAGDRQELESMWRFADDVREAALEYYPHCDHTADPATIIRQLGAALEKELLTPNDECSSV